MDANLLRQISNGGVVTSDISSRSHYQNRAKRTVPRSSSPLWFSKQDD